MLKMSSTLALTTSQTPIRKKTTYSLCENILTLANSLLKNPKSYPCRPLIQVVQGFISPLRIFKIDYANSQR